MSFDGYGRIHHLLQPVALFLSPCCTAVLLKAGASGVAHSPRFKTVSANLKDFVPRIEH
jgi:hypothetical protein